VKNVNLASQHVFSFVKNFFSTKIKENTGWLVRFESVKSQVFAMITFKTVIDLFVTYTDL